MTTEQIIQEIVICSVREWLKDETNNGPLEPANTTLDHKLGYRIRDCIRDAFRKRFPNKGLFHKLRKELADHCFMADDKERRLYSADRDAFNVATDKLVDYILDAMNLDNTKTIEDTQDCRYPDDAGENQERSGFDKMVPSQKPDEPLTVNIYELKKSLENVLEGKESEVKFFFAGWNDSNNEIISKDYVLDILSLSIPDKNTILREVNLTLHRKNPYHGFMTEHEATEIVLDRIIEKVKLSVRLLNNEIKESMKFCIKETHSKSDADPLTKVYGKTKVDCIHKFLSKTVIKDENGLHDRIAADLMSNGRTTVLCNVGRRFVTLTENR